MDQDKKTIVKFRNDFNSVALKNFTVNELNLLMAISSKVLNSGKNKVQFTFLELKKLIKLNKNYTNDEFAEEIINVNRKLLMLNFQLSNENNDVIQFALFNTFITSKVNKTLTVSVNSPFEFLLNDLTANFTKFELEEFVEIRNIYAKECYRRLKQFRSTGYWKVNIEDFREILNIPESYRMCHINDKILRPIEKQLGSYFGNLIIAKIKSNEAGNPITHLEFFFEKEK
ncbi:MAG: replication initiation protein [Peptoniphilus rhinitidis]|uniref:replication initiation protein n=1 Tax=Peptoniphilus rhinitidis TaxID=1175452 RepID=UPI0028FE5BCB|nr:replication initiation protein [Peptoniphilus rhinitidis]MDU2109528.1 replication initiation protein [Peptoniphilus lacydonensis]MDU3750183.1 replication initiation protein [Peptoniphilus rhinitidis]